METLTTTTINLSESICEQFNGVSTSENTTINALRTEAIDQFRTLGFPTKKMEDWRYLSFKKLEKENLQLADNKDYSAIDINSFLPTDAATAATVVFVNGSFQASLSNMGEGIELQTIEDAIADNNPLLSNLNKQIEYTQDAGFLALNTAFFTGGIVLKIKKSTVLEAPIFVLNLSDSSSATHFHQRNLIVAEENAQAQIVHFYASLNEDKNTVLSTQVTEAVAAQNSLLEITYIQQENHSTQHINTTFTRQESNGKVTVNTFALSGKVLRNGLTMLFEKEHAESFLNGLYLTNGTELFDNHTVVDHAQANCYSNELYKGVMAGESTAVFNGKIFVREDAQKTNAFQTNRNVILNDGASVNTKPQLEIFADDVQCSHGCTIGRLDKDAIFYMQARGIRKVEAEKILIRGFANEVVERIGLDSIKEFLTTRIESKLNKMFA